MFLKFNFFAPKLTEVVDVLLDPLLEFIHGFPKIIISSSFDCDLVDHASLHAMLPINALSLDFLVRSASAWAAWLRPLILRSGHHFAVAVGQEHFFEICESPVAHSEA